MIVAKCLSKAARNDESRHVLVTSGGAGREPSGQRQKEHAERG